MKQFLHKTLLTLTIALMAGFGLQVGAVQVPSMHDAPKKANYFLGWTMTSSEAEELAKWDLVILDMEIGHRHPELLRQMRLLNPDIKILVYITPQEIRQDAAVSFSQMRKKLVQGVHPDWYLAEPGGARLSWWPETYLLNVTQDKPLRANKKWNDYLVDFVVNELLSTGLWDGVFYDNAWDNISHFAGTTNIDLNRNGFRSANVDRKWMAGMNYIYEQTRERAQEDIIIVGNGNTDEYVDVLDGLMFENFHQFPWSFMMNTYREAGDWSVINENTGNTGDQANYQRIRFGLTSALLEDGYYSFDFGDKSHGQLWWYDEYNVDLGQGNGPAKSQLQKRDYEPDIWQRDYERGRIVVNSTNEDKIIDLGADFEKIHGEQDPLVNTGEIVSETAIAAKDGLVLLKPLAVLYDTLFRVNDFVRFRRADGSRARNGFFVTDPARNPGETIMRADVNGDGKRDLVISSGNKLEVWRHDDQPYHKTFPYTASYKGSLQVAVADLDRDGKSDILVAPETGKHPIKIYSYDGALKEASWYPLGKYYAGGYSLAVTDDSETKIIVGSGGSRAQVRVYDKDKQLLTSWFPYGFSRSRAHVASGDVNGDGKSEVITGAGKGSAPTIKIFDPAGSLLYKQFSAFSSFFDSDISLLQTSDIDFDGIDDILVFSSGI